MTDDTAAILAALDAAIETFRGPHRTTLRALRSRIEKERHAIPEVGAVLKCLVCALNREWGIFDETTGATVCRLCRDRARYLPTPYEADAKEINWRSEFDQYITKTNERERERYRRGYADAMKRIEKERPFVEAAMAYCAHLEAEPEGMGEDWHSWDSERFMRGAELARAYRALISEKPPEEGAKS